eukprot:gene17569-biopygen8955
MGAVDYLIAEQGLAAAREVVVTGGSAGGLATFLHVDRVAARIQRAAAARNLLLFAPPRGYTERAGYSSRSPGKKLGQRPSQISGSGSSECDPAGAGLVGALSRYLLKATTSRLLDMSWIPHLPSHPARELKRSSKVFWELDFAETRNRG